MTIDSTSTTNNDVLHYIEKSFVKWIKKAKLKREQVEYCFNNTTKDWIIVHWYGRDRQAMIEINFNLIRRHYKRELIDYNIQHAVAHVGANNWHNEDCKHDSRFKEFLLEDMRGQSTALKAVVGLGRR